MRPQHPALQQLQQDPRPRPLVASHRGDSRHHPENTLSAFASAARLGVAIQEFDVRQLACGELVCVHDASWDRTTDASAKLGPGALVAQTRLATARSLDAGTWHRHGSTETVPTLAEALQAMLPACVPLIEHKSGDAQRYVDALRGGGPERSGHSDGPGLSDWCDQVILQSFDWHFLAEVHRLEPSIAIGALGPNHVFATATDQALDLIAGFGAELVHWRASSWTQADVRRAHERGLWTCSYTTDDELGWLGGQALGLDSMCTNDPATMAEVIGR